MSDIEKLLDKDIREPLFAWLEETYGKIRIIEEKSMGRSRADVIMVIPGALCGIEIKSDADSYTRLTRQIKDYDRYFDYNIVVVGSSHAQHIEEHVPEHWGIITVEETEGDTDFYYLRRPQTNPNMEMMQKIRFLWRPELAHIQEVREMHAYKRMSKEFVEEKIVQKIPAEELNELISEELFERDYNTIAERINAYRVANGQKPRRRRRRRKSKV